MKSKFVEGIAVGASVVVIIMAIGTVKQIFNYKPKLKPYSIVCDTNGYYAGTRKDGTIDPNTWQFRNDQEGLKQWLRVSQEVDAENKDYKKEREKIKAREELVRFLNNQKWKECPQ